MAHKIMNYFLFTAYKDNTNKKANLSHGENETTNR